MRTPGRLLRRAPWPRLAATLAGLGLGLALLGPTTNALERSAGWARSQPALQVRTVDVAPLEWMEADPIRVRVTEAAPATLFDSLEPVREAVGQIPGVRAVQVRRRLPGIVWVRVTEDPLLARTDGGALTRTGAVVSPRSDVPLPARTWSGPVTASALAILDDLTETDPAWLAGVRRARARGGDLAVTWHPNGETDPVTLLLGPATRIPSSGLLLTVLEDARRRGSAVATLDLRYRGQVITRPR